MTIYLYKKTHNKTGLQYLGKTVQDPFKYSGSGLIWEDHVRQHGNDITTEILRECSSTEELSYWGRYYSKLWNIVESTEWANKIPETGGGPGNDSETAKAISKKMVENGNHNFLGGNIQRQSNLNRAKNGTHPFLGPDLNNKRVKEGTHPFQKKPDGTSFAAERVKIKKTCEYCHKEVDISNYGRWHGDRCRLK